MKTVQVGTFPSPLDDQCSSSLPVVLVVLAAVVAIALGTGCGGTGAFAFSSEDNNAVALAKAFATEQKPPDGKPSNMTGEPLVFYVSTGVPRKLAAWNLVEGKSRWSVEANVTSRIAVGSSLVAYREGKDKIVARDVRSGAVLWSVPIGAKQTFLGVAAESDHVFYVVQDDTKKRTWLLVAVEHGKELWHSEAPGTLGAPAARGGLVFMPFMTQWLTILDAKTGQQLARIRQDDEAINFVRTTSDGVFYGSRGVFLLDDRSIAGKKGGATYGAAKLPDFVRTFYYFDAFKSVQAEYSAFDRNRVLWRAHPKEGALNFQDGLAVVFTYRFFFGFDATTGELKWAHHHPRFDVVSAEHVGGAIVYLSQAGELGVLDPVTGTRLAMSNVGDRVLGATFDADGYRPGTSGESVDTPAALSSIVVDKDSRFGNQKLFAIDSLGKIPGAEAAEILLGLLHDENTPAPIYQRAGDVLVARKDPQALPNLLDALKVRTDFLRGSKASGVDVIARALGAISAAEAAPALLAHLEDPSTPQGSLKDLAVALGACKNPAVLPRLRAFLLMYRSDPLFAGDSDALAALMDALLSVGGAAERELLAYVASEPRTLPVVAEYARRVLAESTKTKLPGK